MGQEATRAVDGGMVRVMEVAMVRRVAMVGGSVVMAEEAASEMGEEVQAVKEEAKTATGVIQTRRINGMEKGQQAGATAKAARKQQGQGGQLEQCS